jgi:RNA polymerase sigma factor (sigma-70 family)
LVEVIKAGDEEDVNEAVKALQVKYHRDLDRYLYYTSQKLQYAGLGKVEPEDAAQEAWFAVVRYLKKNEVEKDFKGLLRWIAHNKCIDIARKQKVEWSIEHDIPYILSDVDVERSAMDNEVERLISQPWVVGSLLSDCERVITTLKNMKCSSRLIGKLLGKSPHNVDVWFSNARKRVSARFNDDDFRFKLANNSYGEDAGLLLNRKPILSVERFAEPMSLRYLAMHKIDGLEISLKEEDFVASLILPASDIDYRSLSLDKFYFLLTEKSGWKHMQEEIKRFYPRGVLDVEGLKDLFCEPPSSFPKEYLIEVNTEGDDIRDLNFRYCVEFVPDFLTRIELKIPGVKGSNISHTMHSTNSSIPIFSKVYRGLFDRLEIEHDKSEIDMQRLDIRLLLEKKDIELKQRKRILDEIVYKETGLIYDGDFHHQWVDRFPFEKSDKQIATEVSYEKVLNEYSSLGEEYDRLTRSYELLCDTLNYNDVVRDTASADNFVDILLKSNCLEENNRHSLTTDLIPPEVADCGLLRFLGLLPWADLIP